MKLHEKILEKTDGGLDIFSYYLGEGCLKKKFKSPFRSGDKRPSCHLYLNKPVGKQEYYYLQDFGDSKCSGNAFDIAARVLNINIRYDFLALLKRIDQDLCLNVFEENKGKQPTKPIPNRAAIKEEINKNKTSSIKSFTPVIQRFTADELKYWSKYGIDEDTLERYHVQSLRSVTFHKADGKSFEIFGSKAIPAFGYFFNNMEGIKVYRPKAANRFLYGGNLPTPYVFGWEQLPQAGNDIFITGGEKDVLSLAAHGFNAIAFNSETAKIPEDKIAQLSQRFKRIIFLYDSDTTGIKESKNRVEEYKDKFKCIRIQLPLKGSKEEKDISDYFSLGKTAEEFQHIVNSL